ncbi:MBL fold metallo-hydrolase [Paenibacillus alginolyticus]|uniref:MBL fold metallo-hydrolase n=1 Tax=Paenibacillus alginolyticus TaxID=59839 RepID=A0ABT4GJP4_9BACL|nr:MBL fold metallo-hydrolase [Paenibacillus alginolyticus]MCY9696420.1 MBL fold metallo-hydrolase [Paenibacillus alginolyticus]MEC0145265.1 MBL fold metallo-hydrolase [Paenibacillus alginolyticus]
MTKNRLQVFWTICLAFLLLVGGCTPSKTTIEPVQSEAKQNNKQVSELAISNEPKQSESDRNKQQMTEVTKDETKGELKVHYIDVGQGASQLIIGSSGKTILIDAGNNDKATLVVNYLKKQGVSKIDILIGTHPDADHVGGLDAVIDNFEIGKIYMPKVQSNTKTFEDVLLAIQRKGLKVATAKAGLTLDWEMDTNVQMIAPVEQYSDTNEMSAVIHLSYGQTSFLFMGDAESKSEQDMISSKVNLRSDVLLVGHHGSNSSSSQAFLDAVKPSYAVIQVGKSNNYGHPTAEVLKRLLDRGIKTYRTDDQGNIIFTTNGKDILVKYDNGITVPIKGEIAPTSTNNPSSVKSSEVPKKQEDNVVYNNCSEVRAAGKAPIKRGDPGYSNKLDRDNDGVGCE